MQWGSGKCPVVGPDVDWNKLPGPTPFSPCLLVHPKEYDQPAYTVGFWFLIWVNGSFSEAAQSQADKLKRQKGLLGAQSEKGSGGWKDGKKIIWKKIEITIRRKQWHGSTACD